MRWARHVACMGEIRNAYSFLVGNAEERRTELQFYYARMKISSYSHVRPYDYIRLLVSLMVVQVFFFFFFLFFRQVDSQGFVSGI
jgi:hypothetical protein